MNNSTKFWIVFCSILLIYGNVVMVKNFKEMQKSSEKHTYCGVVVNSTAQERTTKHRTITDTYLLVNFDDLDDDIAIDVDMTTFLSKKIGDRVCFNLSNSKTGKYENKKSFACEAHTFLLSGLTFFSDVILIVVAIIFLVKLINEYLDQ